MSQIDEVIDLLLPVLFYRVHAYRWKKLHGVNPKAMETDLPPDKQSSDFADGSTLVTK